MDFSLAEIWHSMGLPAKLVTITLLLMGISCLAIILERLYYLTRASQHSRVVAIEASKLMKQGDLDELIMLSEKHKLSHLGYLLAIGVHRYLLHAEDDDRSGVGAIEMARREMQRRSEMVSSELRRGMGVLATVGSIGPFVGLFGTVVGIITAFQGIAKTGSGGLGAVSAGIAEALAVTALGLVVAIPAVAFFNMLSAKIEATELALGHATGEFLDELERIHGNVGRSSGEREVA